MYPVNAALGGAYVNLSGIRGICNQSVTLQLQFPLGFPTPIMQEATRYKYKKET
jgi:hypothetical protein